MTAVAKEPTSSKNSLHCHVNGVDADAKSVTAMHGVFFGEGVGQATKLYGGFKPK